MLHRVHSLTVGLTLSQVLLVQNLKADSLQRLAGRLDVAHLGDTVSDLYDQYCTSSTRRLNI